MGHYWQCWALKGMGFTHEVDKVVISPSNPHVYLAPRIGRY